MVLGATKPKAGLSPPGLFQESAAETLRSLQMRMRQFGITRVADITGLDRIGIPVAIAIRPKARSVTVSQGKAADLVSAKIAALMEAIEVWHAENIHAPLVLASIGEVKIWEKGCDVDRLPAGMRSRTDDTRLLWIEGENLVTSEPKLVPFEMVHADYASPVKPGHGIFPASTNGLASGRDRSAAAVAAICEVIERDALSVWHQLSLPARSATRIDLSTIDDPACLWAAERFAKAGLELAVWDVTSDLAVPTFLALIYEASGQRRSHVGLGSGSHPDRSVALLRALTEAAQTRLTYISGSRDDLEAQEFTDFGQAQKRQLADDLLRAGPPRRAVADGPSFSSGTAQANLDWLVARLTASGLTEIVAVDLAKEAIGIPVVRVVVPGLEAPHDDPGYVPGLRAREAAARG